MGARKADLGISESGSRLGFIVVLLRFTRFSAQIGRLLLSFRGRLLLSFHLALSSVAFVRTVVWKRVINSVVFSEILSQGGASIRAMVLDSPTAAPARDARLPYVPLPPALLPMLPAKTCRTCQESVGV